MLSKKMYSGTWHRIVALVWAARLLLAWRGMAAALDLAPRARTGTAATPTRNRSAGWERTGRIPLLFDKPFDGGEQVIGPDRLADPGINRQMHVVRQRRGILAAVNARDHDDRNLFQGRIG